MRLGRSATLGSGQRYYYKIFRGVLGRITIVNLQVKENSALIFRVLSVVHFLAKLQGNYGDALLRMFTKQNLKGLAVDFHEIKIAVGVRGMARKPSLPRVVGAVRVPLNKPSLCREDSISELVKVNVHTVVLDALFSRV